MVNEALKMTKTAEEPDRPIGQPPHPNMVWIPGGTFRMGSEGFYPEEGPVHKVSNEFK